MPDLTTPFSKVFDVLRKVTTANATTLKLYRNSGSLITTITDGWFPEEVTKETDGEEVKQIHVTDRAGVDFKGAQFFGFGGYKYERTTAPGRPDGNPREWIWKVKPAGLDS